MAKRELVVIRNRKTVALLLESIETLTNNGARKVSKKRMRVLLNRSVSAALWVVEPQATTRQQENAVTLLTDIEAELTDGKARNRLSTKDRHLAL